MNFNMEAIVDFQAQATAPLPQHGPTTQHLAPWQRVPFPGLPPPPRFRPSVYQVPSHGVDESFRHMPSPAASQSESAAPQSIESTRDDLNNQLRAERDRLISDKDRLMTEKDKLVNEKLRLVEEKERAMNRSEELQNSKSALWQEYYETVRSRDEQIKQLKEDHGSLARELKAQQKQNRRLAAALHEYMENDGTATGPEDEAPSHDERGLGSILETEHAPKVSKAERTSSWIGELAQPNIVETEARKQMVELFSPKPPEIARDDHDTDEEPPAKRAKTSETVAAPEIHTQDYKLSLQVPRPSSVIELSSCGRSSSSVILVKECKALSRPAGPVSSLPAPASTPQPRRLFPEAEPQNFNGSTEMSESLRKLKNNFLSPMKFTIRPLVRPENDTGGYGQLEQLDTRVMDSICDTLLVLQQKVQQGKVRKAPAHKTKGCCTSWMRSSKDHLWTADQPRLFTCKTCFNSRRTCLLWQGDGVWDLLPLPPQIRRQDATPTDHEYYIFGQDASWRDFGEVWESSGPKKYKTKHRVA